MAYKEEILYLIDTH